MKIGLLAYHSACNFGATLQLLSTYMYLKKRGHDPIVINWISADLENRYGKITPLPQQELQLSLRKQLWRETGLCRTSEDVAKVITKESIQAVIIGSDAVAQHHPMAERIVFPCKRIIGLRKVTSDMVFPNPFWATWLDSLEEKIPVAVMSASCQDSRYRLTPKAIRREMAKQVMRYSYISVRDAWTSQMISYITKGERVPAITPDPVFAFNRNSGDLIPSEGYIRNTYGIKGRYILLSFLDSRRGASVKQEWIESFTQAAKSEGLEIIMLPFAEKRSFGNSGREIRLPLSPLDWYALIKYSDGYVGNNMHPVIVSIHNSVPFFSFDNYGTKHLNGIITSDVSSKIRHILNKAGLGRQRVSSLPLGFRPPTAQDVMMRILTFDRDRCSAFAENYLKDYDVMMKDIEKALGL